MCLHWTVVGNISIQGTLGSAFDEYKVFHSASDQVSIHVPNTRILAALPMQMCMLRKYHCQGEANMREFAKRIELWQAVKSSHVLSVLDCQVYASRCSSCRLTCLDL